MDYRYKRNQIFKKALPVPNHIKGDVYDCKLSFIDFINYALEDKVPISCLHVSDRQIVQRFGIEKCKKLDWSILSTQTYGKGDIKVILLGLSPETEDLNDALYKALNHKLPPQNYSEGMKKKYPNSGTLRHLEAVEYMMFNKVFDDEDCLEKIKKRG